MHLYVLVFGYFLKQNLSILSQAMQKFINALQLKYMILYIKKNNHGKNYTYNVCKFKAQIVVGAEHITKTRLFKYRENFTS